MANMQLVLESRFFEIMGHIGWLDKFTIRSHVVMFIICVFGAMNIASTVFLTAKMDFSCAVSEEIKTNISEKCGFNWTDLQNSLISPKKENKTVACERYSESALINSVNCSYWESGIINTNLTTEKCTSWTYDQSVYQSTIVSEFDLVCGDGWKTSMSQFLLMVGVFFGAMLCGISSDKWGRRTFFATSLVIIVVAACISSTAINYWMYAMVHLFTGFGGIGLCVTGYVYVMEITKDEHRVIIAGILQCTFSVGFMLLALCGYLQRNWVFLNLAVSLPLLALLPIYIWISGESPRWLLSKNKSDRAEATLRMMAATNGKEIDEFLNLSDTIHLSMDENNKLVPEESQLIEQTSTVDLFCIPKLRIISLILFYNWFAVTCLYYGLTLNATKLDGNPFLNFFLSGLIELPAYLGSAVLIHTWGRRPTIFVSNMLCGVSLLLLNFFPKGAIAAKTALFLIGKFGSSATFSCIYLYTSELYPTPLRGNGVGICSGCARLGAMASTLIFMLDSINENLPYVVFGGIAALAGILIVTLPETKGRKLPETLEDTEKLFSQRSVTLLQQFVPQFLRTCRRPSNDAKRDKTAVIDCPPF